MAYGPGQAYPPQPPVPESGGINPSWLASSADRERAVGVLRAGFTEGRLTESELDERVAQAYAARTYGQLWTLTSDLPVGAIPYPQAPHGAGAIAHAAGVVTANGQWCEVDFLTFESIAVKNVHVLGDSIQVAPLMPKSGHMANSQAKVCAAAVLACTSFGPAFARASDVGSASPLLMHSRRLDRPAGATSSSTPSSDGTRTRWLTRCRASALT